MKEKPMRTKFIVEKPPSKELFILTIPECDMCRLQKGDVIQLHKYTRGYPFNDLEAWEAVVTDTPTFDINWSDHADAGAFTYDGDSVIPMQVVRVRILKHRWA